jgi:hypothetical protein
VLLGLGVGSSLQSSGVAWVGGSAGGSSGRMLFVCIDGAPKYCLGDLLDHVTLDCLGDAAGIACMYFMLRCVAEVCMHANPLSQHAIPSG